MLFRSGGGVINIPELVFAGALPLTELTGAGGFEVSEQPDEENRFNALKAVFSQLMADATLTPLFNYHYRISAPPGVNGVRLTPRGWFEFTEAWLPAPSQ